MRHFSVAVISITLVLAACGGDDADPASTIEAIALRITQAILMKL